jgi:hypothetical protein
METILETVARPVAVIEFSQEWNEGSTIICEPAEGASMAARGVSALWRL